MMLPQHRDRIVTADYYDITSLLPINACSIYDVFSIRCCHFIVFRQKHSSFRRSNQIISYLEDSNHKNGNDLV